MSKTATAHWNRTFLLSWCQTQVNDIAFTAPGKKAIGSFIWEPLSTWEGVFDRDGKSNKYLDVYPAIAKKYGVK